MVQYGVRFYQIGKAQLNKIKNYPLKDINSGVNFEVEENVGTVFLWQIISWAYGFCFSLNITITTVYWLFLSQYSNEVIRGFIFHIAPMVAIGIDFILNLVVIELNLMVWTVFAVSIYLLINFIYTNYILFSPVYPILTWASWQTSVRDVIMYSAVGPVLHLIGWLLTWLKLRLLIGERPSLDKKKSGSEDTLVVMI